MAMARLVLRRPHLRHRAAARAVVGCNCLPAVAALSARNITALALSSGSIAYLDIIDFFGPPVPTGGLCAACVYVWRLRVPLSVKSAI